MKSYEYDYNNLSKKYQDFILPYVAIKINGKEVKTLLSTENQKDKSLNVGYVIVNLSIENPSMAQVKILNTYNYSNSSITQVVTIGSTIEIYLGYSNDKNTSKVFSGYIARVDYQFGDNFGVLITALDVLNLMKQEYCPKYYISKSYGDIINDIVGNYSQLITSKKFDTLNTTKEFIHREEKISDLDFIRRLCAENGKMFFVSNGIAYITDKFGDKPIINLDIHEALKTFTFSQIYQNSKIKVIGFDSENHDTEIIAESSITTHNSKTVTVLPQTKVITNPNISTSSDAKNYADSLVQNIAKNTSIGNISCIGLPEILVGRTITISGVDKLTFDTYNFNITKVTHTLDANGFNTNINITGWS